MHVPYPMFFSLMANKNNDELTTTMAAICTGLMFILCVLFTQLGLAWTGPYITAFFIGLIYVIEFGVSLSAKKGTMPKAVIWGSWILHLCCLLFLLGYLYRTGYISGNFEWSEDMGHGNFEYHTESPSCWNIFWWLGGIRLTVLQIFHLWWHR